MCVFTAAGGGGKRLQTLCVTLSTVRQEERRGQEDCSMTGKSNSAMRYSSKYSSNHFNEITAQLWSKCFQLDKNLGSTSQKTILNNMGMLPTLVEGKQMTQCCEMARSHSRQHLVKATPHFLRFKRLFCAERLQEVSSPLAHFHNISLLFNDYLRTKNSSSYCRQRK